MAIETGAWVMVMLSRARVISGDICCSFGIPRGGGYDGVAAAVVPRLRAGGGSWGNLIASRSLITLIAGSCFSVAVVVPVRVGAVARHVIVASSRMIMRGAGVDGCMATVIMPLLRARPIAGDVAVVLGLVVMPRAGSGGVAAVIVTMTMLVGVAARDVVVASGRVVTPRTGVLRHSCVTIISVAMLMMVMAVRLIAVTPHTFAVLGNTLEETLWSGPMLVIVVDNMTSSVLLARVVGDFSGSPMRTIMSISVIMGRRFARNVGRHVMGSGVRRGGNFAGCVARGSINIPGLVFV